MSENGYLKKPCAGLVLIIRIFWGSQHIYFIIYLLEQMKQLIKKKNLYGSVKTHYILLMLTLIIINITISSI